MKSIVMGILLRNWPQAKSISPGCEPALFLSIPGSEWGPAGGIILGRSRVASVICEAPPPNRIGGQADFRCLARPELIIQAQYIVMPSLGKFWFLIIEISHMCDERLIPSSDGYRVCPKREAPYWRRAPSRRCDPSNPFPSLLTLPPRVISSAARNPPA